MIFEVENGRHVRHTHTHITAADKSGKSMLVLLVLWLTMSKRKSGNGELLLRLLLHVGELLLRLLLSESSETNTINQSASTTKGDNLGLLIVIASDSSFNQLVSTTDFWFPLFARLRDLQLPVHKQDEGSSINLSFRKTVSTHVPGIEPYQVLNHSIVQQLSDVLHVAEQRLLGGNFQKGRSDGGEL